jgi:hypothetical protein
MAVKTHCRASATMVFGLGLNCLIMETKGFGGKTPLFIGFTASRAANTPCFIVYTGGFIVNLIKFSANLIKSRANVIKSE